MTAAAAPQETAPSQGSKENQVFAESGDQLSSPSSSVAVTSSSSSAEAKSDSETQPPTTEARGSSTASGPQQQAPADEQEGARLVQAEVHASLENGQKEPPSTEEKREDSDRRDKEEEEEANDEEDASRKEDYSEGDLVDISAYSGIGEDDSGGSQLEDEEDEEAYQPETSCSEITGLPEEDEPAPANRKIRFSTEPIKVRELFLPIFSF